MNGIMSDAELRYYLSRNDLKGLIKRCLEIRRPEFEKIQKMRERKKQRAKKLHSSVWREVPRFQRGAAARYARRIVADSKKAEMKPRLGGEFWQHFQGKLAELLFLKHAREHKLNIHTAAIRRDYRKLSSFTECDFEINGKTIELKSRRNPEKNKKYPYLYPIAQLQENEISDFTVFIEFNAALTEYRYGGFIKTYRIFSFKKREDLPLPAYLIPPQVLEPILDFWRMFR